MTGVRAHAAENVAELSRLLEVIEESELEALVAEILHAGRVFLAGHGRSGLVARAFAMRLMHLGLGAHVVGETATPSIGSGDLLVCLSASGTGSSTHAQLASARQAGARIAALSSATTTPLARDADLVVAIPARVRVATRQHAGSLFEQASLVVADAVCAVLQERIGVTTAEMDARHANLQ